MYVHLLLRRRVIIVIIITIDLAILRKKNIASIHREHHVEMAKSTIIENNKIGKRTHSQVKN